MSDPVIDIIVPIWNRPVETRNCLVHLIEHTPQARFILVDNGCERETERLLEEFAEILDQRALLLRNDVNQGYVRAVNRGMARAEAPYLAIIRNTSLVTAGWLEPLLGFARERSEAGVIVPRLIPGTTGISGKGGAPPVAPIEADHGSFAAMLLKKQAFDAVGGMDEEMDGGLWCLRDYSRRAYRAGFLTFRVPEGTVFYKDDIMFGSAERREIALQSSISRYRERWGRESSFCVYMPKEADLNILWQKLAVLQQGARQGHFFTVLTHGRLHKELMQAGCHNCHEHIRFERLPLMFETGAIRRALAGANDVMPGVRAVTGIDGIPFPNAVEGIPFAELERLVAATRVEKYGN
jgi:GT2 family glycosyltransferase